MVHLRFLTFYSGPLPPKYSASLTFSIQFTAFPSSCCVIAMCVMAVVRRSAVPMLLTWRAPHNVARSNLLDRTSPALHETATGCDDQNLTPRMRMPCCSSARFEGHTSSESTFGIGRLEQRVNAHGAREIFGGSFCRGLRTTSCNLHLVSFVP